MALTFLNHHYCKTLKSDESAADAHQIQHFLFLSKTKLRDATLNQKITDEDDLNRDKKQTNK